MKILVMGGTQFNGLAAVHALVKAGHDVTILNRGQTEAQLPEGLNRLYGDRTDHDQMRSVLGGLEFDVIHDLTAYHRADSELMVEIFEGRVGHYICASSTVIYAHGEVGPYTEASPLESGEDQIEYGQGKIDLEHYLFDLHRERNFPVTMVPFSMVFGPRNIIPDREQRMMTRLIQGRPILVPGDGSTMLQVTHVEDQGRALALMAGLDESHGERYNICAPIYPTDIGYIQTMADVLGVSADMRFIPHDVMDALWEGDLSFDLGESTAPKIDIRSSDEGKKRRAGRNLKMKFQLSTVAQRLAPNIHRWNHSSLFSSEKLTRLVDWKPEHDLKSMVEHVWDWYQRENLAETQTFDWTFEDQILAHISE